MTRQGFFNFSHGRGHETWMGTKYRVGSDVNFFGNMQVLRWLNLGGNFQKGPSILYSETNPFQGHSKNYGIGVTIQPNQHLSQDLEYSTVRFTRPSTGALVPQLVPGAPPPLPISGFVAINRGLFFKASHLRRF